MIRVYNVLDIENSGFVQLSPIDSGFDYNLSVVTVSDDYELIIGASR